jgi:hypothetical protein
MKRFVSVTGKDERRQASPGNLYAELFIKLADQALLWGFSVLNLTAGELPEARQLFTTRPLSYENAPVDVHQRRGGDKNHRLCNIFGGHAGLIARGLARA